MKLQDYLHYYLHGQIWEAGVTTCTLIGIGDSYYTIKTKQGTLLTLSNRADIKLVLRRLEDMTEEEAITLYRLSTKTPFLSADKDEYDVTYIKDKEEICSIQVVDLRISRMYMNINIEGDILIYIHEQNEEPKICERVANQHEATHYLLKQGFDLFGLIPAGLAIDAKNLPNA
jgi:hypothetical protein